MFLLSIEESFYQEYNPFIYRTNVSNTLGEKQKTISESKIFKEF